MAEEAKEIIRVATEQMKMKIPNRERLGFLRVSITAMKQELLALERVNDMLKMGPQKDGNETSKNDGMKEAVEARKERQVGEKEEREKMAGKEGEAGSNGVANEERKKMDGGDGEAGKERAGMQEEEGRVVGTAAGVERQ
ncbi:hypothetical protein CPB84DRAFT_1843903 [Gymnopilus junonius]|uniref:Uncharacterized protein n=1 Tax=Gymnopilus junonius TaxID=109634 RepID=A0A9P5NVD3_GYMJU|nr:hypothetical protein CPB84DRAFT_1843903 [Gymnopilus junonius]